MYRPKFETVKDDAVECWFYPCQKELEGGLQKISKSVKQIITEKSEQYIWHKDRFEVFQPVQKLDEGLPPHLYSITYYGDNIEDEWFIVYLLMEISKLLPDLTIQVRDNDGEFLLIEAADLLPAWASPESTNNRVFIHGGCVHLIQNDIADVKKTLPLTEAIEILQKYPHKTKAADAIQNAIAKRIGDYPEKIEDTLHRSIVNLPYKYAALLKYNPLLISQSVNTFCGLDAFESKLCKNIKSEACVDTTVVFTKCLYAMLTHASSIPSLSWKLPSPTSPDYKKATLGYKITCGLEVLLRKASQDTFSTKQWKSFLDSLKSNGYFKENIEGSKAYTMLLEDAKKYYVANECSNAKAYVGNNIKMLLDSDDFLKFLKSYNKEKEILCEDNDSWLNIQPEQLNDLLNSRYGKQSKFSQKDLITPQTVSKEISNFLKKESDFEGIEIDEDRIDSDTNDENLNFDCEQFADAVKNILDFVLPEDNWNLDSGTDLSEFGSEDEMNTEVDDEITANLEKELLASTLTSSLILNDETKKVDVEKNAYVNLMKSMKEEMGSSGPSSNLLSRLGIPKHAEPELDSDDDIE